MEVRTHPSSLRVWWTIVWKDFLGYFSTPVGYVVLALFLLINGLFFVTFVRDSAQATLVGPLSIMLTLALFLSPIITMRLFAEEKKLGTLQLLMTKPVNDVSVVLGKFCASVLYALTMILPTLIYVAVIFRYGNPDIGPIWTGYLGVFLVMLAFLSLGVFASVLTENQIISVVLAFVFLLVFWLASDFIGISASFTGAQAIGYLSLRAHVDDFLRGIVDVKDVIYLLSFVVFWLFATVKVLESRKWK